MAPLVWLSFEVAEDGTVRTVETLGDDGGIRREERRFGSLEEAAGRYGDGFLAVAREVLASGSRRGRWRP